ncbi:MAG: hypothetical protein AABX30_02045 [Nanoarchaeota archaeon]
MNLLNSFEYFLDMGIVRKISKDKSRASFLVKESGSSLEGLKERIKIIGINDKNANSIIKDCYDIIMELIRAKLLLDGYYASGNYAHEAEISYLKKLNFLEKEILFLNQLRSFRNSITYRGEIFDKEYAEKVFDFLIKIMPKFKNLKDLSR